MNSDELNTKAAMLPLPKAPPDRMTQGKVLGNIVMRLISLDRPDSEAFDVECGAEGGGFCHSEW